MKRNTHEELVSLSRYGNTEKIALEAWNKVKEDATREELLGIVRYGDNKKIAKEALELLYYKGDKDA